MTDHKIDYFEIGTPEPAKAREFYGGLFGWQVGEPAGPARYATVDEGAGGLWDTAEFGSETWAIFYVRVADLPGAIARAQELGADVAIPFTDNGRIQFAHLVDPLGNRFGVWRPNA